MSAAFMTDDEVQPVTPPLKQVAGPAVGQPKYLSDEQVGLASPKFTSGELWRKALLDAFSTDEEGTPSRVPQSPQMEPRELAGDMSKPYIGYKPIKSIKPSGDDIGSIPVAADIPTSMVKMGLDT